ncbi:MAG: SDR family oxidoreductase [Solirubrobacterales bacterium]
MNRLGDKTAIVTGSSRGIGRSVAARLRAEGAALVLVSRDAETGKAQAEELGGPVVHVAGSVEDPSTADRAIAAAADLGGVDVLVNNAAVDLVGRLTASEEADVRRVFDVNLFGTLWMLRSVAAELERLRRPGSIVNVTSRLASVGVPEMTIYGSSKGAVLALTRGAAVELAPRGIRVNAVAPGMTATPMFEEYLAGHTRARTRRREVEESIPQRRLADPADVAAAVAFLAADESSHITGASIPVDGGYTAA